jgi:hypothetical protein
MKQAANLKDFRTTNLLPGITINTSAIDFAPIKQSAAQEVQGREMGAVRPMLSSEAGD